MTDTAFWDGFDVAALWFGRIALLLIWLFISLTLLTALADKVLRKVGWMR